MARDSANFMRQPPRVHMYIYNDDDDSGGYDHHHHYRSSSS